MAVIVALTAATTVACGGSESPTTAERQPQALSIPAVILRVDNGWSTTVLTPLGTAPFTPTVIVYDQYAQPMLGVPVSFIARGVTDSTSRCGSAVESVVLTDASGRASCGAWTVGSAEGNYYLNVVAPSGADWATRKNGSVIDTEFGVPVLRPDPPGEVFDLIDRKGYSLIETGHLVIADDRTYKLVYFGTGTEPNVRVLYGTFTQSASVYTLIDASKTAWATFLVSGDVATLSYDILNDDNTVFAHVVEDYARRH